MPYEAEVSVLLAFDAASLAAFSALVLRTPKLASKLSSPQWAAMHGIPVLCNVLAVISTACQLFLAGRTEAGCAALHGTAGSCYWVMAGMMRVYFMLRVVLVHGTAPRASRNFDFAVLGVLCAYVPAVVVWFNLATWTFLSPGDGVCLIGFARPFVVHLVGVPTAFDVIINWRFFTYIVLANRVSSVRNIAARSAAVGDCDMRIGRLVKITALFFMFQTIFALVLALMLFGAIPVPPGSQTVVFVLEQSVNAGSTIWPYIVVQCMKLPALWNNTSASARGDDDSSAVKSGGGDDGSKMQPSASRWMQISYKSRAAGIGEAA